MPKLFTQSIANIEASQKLARDLYDDYLSIDPNFTLFFKGGLGAGKTFLIREILRHFGINEPISSPTYALVNEYETDDRRFAHFDFYRLEAPQDFFARGFADITADPKVSHFIEWPEKIETVAPDAFAGTQYTLQIDFGAQKGAREVTLIKK